MISQRHQTMYKACSLELLSLYFRKLYGCEKPPALNEMLDKKMQSFDLSLIMYRKVSHAVMTQSKRLNYNWLQICYYLLICFCRYILQTCCSGMLGPLGGTVHPQDNTVCMHLLMFLVCVAQYFSNYVWLSLESYATVQIQGVGYLSW